MRQISKMENRDNVVEELGYKREQRDEVMAEGIC